MPNLIEKIRGRELRFGIVSFQGASSSIPPKSAVGGLTGSAKLEGAASSVIIGTTCPPSQPEAQGRAPLTRAKAAGGPWSDSGSTDQVQSGGSSSVARGSSVAGL